MRHSEFSILPLFLPPLLPVPHTMWVSDSLGQQPCSRPDRVFSICENKSCSEPRAVPSDWQPAQSRQQMLAFFVNPKPNYAWSSPTSLGEKNPPIWFMDSSHHCWVLKQQNMFFSDVPFPQPQENRQEWAWWWVWCLPTVGLCVGVLHMAGGQLNSHKGMKQDLAFSRHAGVVLTAAFSRFLGLMKLLPECF